MPRGTLPPSVFSVLEEQARGEGSFHHAHQVVNVFAAAASWLVKKEAENVECRIRFEIKEYEEELIFFGFKRTFPAATDATVTVFALALYIGECFLERGEQVEKLLIREPDEGFHGSRITSKF
mgnify:CR=1 FL=1